MGFVPRLVDYGVHAVIGYGVIALLYGMRFRLTAWWTELQSVAPQALAMSGLFCLLQVLLGLAFGFDIAGAGVPVTVLVLAAQAIMLLPFFLLGLVFCRRLGFDPFGATETRRVLRFALLAVGVAVVAIIMVQLVNRVLLTPLSRDLLRERAWEAAPTAQPQDPFSVRFGRPLAIWQVLLLLLPGMLAEEGLYRLFALTGIWLLTRRQWVALIGSSAVFAAVHFLPSSGFAETFWSAPIYHFGSMLLSGVLYGATYLRWGLGLAAAVHLLYDLIPIIVLRLVA